MRRLCDLEKTLVNVYVPVVGKSYDMFIPLCLQMGEVLELIKTAVTKLSYENFVASNENIICNRDNGEIFDINLSVYELGIRNGSQLMLI